MTPRPPSSVPEIVADHACRQGSGPLWHPGENLLYWMDMHRGSLYSFDPKSARSAPVPVDEKVRHFAVHGEGGLLLFTESGGMKVLKGGSLSDVAWQPAWRPGTQIDAVAVDRQGRVYCAARSAEDRVGSLYRITKDGAIAKAMQGVGSVRSLAFDAGGLAYCCMTASREVTVLRQDPTSGDLCDPHTVVRVPESLGAPYGVSVDAKGFVWIPVWGGSCVLRLSPSGKEERRIYFTARLVSGLTFGGADSRDLYVISSGAEDRAANGPGAGALYRLRPGVKGIPAAPAL